MTREAKATGLIVHRRKRVKYLSLFGAVEIESPYLWNKITGRGARPVKEQLGIEHRRSTLQMERALADFGAEQSFGQAAKRFEEHYGWAIDRATMCREVEETAQKAQQYVEKQLLPVSLDYSQSLATRPGQGKLLVELDDCHIRTGKKVPVESAEVTKTRRLPSAQTADLLSVIQTCRRQGCSVMEFFHKALMVQSSCGTFQLSLLPQPTT